MPELCSYIKAVNGLNHQGGDVIIAVSVNGVTKSKLFDDTKTYLSSLRLLETTNTTSTANQSKEQKDQQEKQGAKELANSEQQMDRLDKQVHKCLKSFQWFN